MIEGIQIFSYYPIHLFSILYQPWQSKKITSFLVKNKKIKFW